MTGPGAARIKGALLALGLSLACPASLRAQADILHDPEVEASLGWLAPAGNLAGKLDPAPQAGLRLTTSYFGNWRAHGQFRFCRLDGNDVLASVYLAQAGTGLQWQSPASPWLPALGMGLGLYYVRIDAKKPWVDRFLFLEEGESEFGFYPFLAWSRRLSKSWRLQWGCQWDVVWSEPEYEHLPSFHLGLGWRP